MLNKTHLSAAVLCMLFSAGCLDPDVNTVRPEHQDARVPSNLCENVVCPLSDDPCTQDGVCDPGVTHTILRTWVVAQRAHNILTQVTRHPSILVFRSNSIDIGVETPCRKKHT